MANKFDEFMQPKVVASNVDGWFPCLYCDEDIDGAYYDRQKDTLSWYCPECAKTSVVEEFALG